MQDYPQTNRRGEPKGAVSEPDIEIIFSEIERTPTRWSDDLVYWRIEAFERASLGPFYAYGTAFVAIGTCSEPHLEFVIVVDQFRREGIGNAIVRAGMRRWPNLDLGEAISDEGQSLVDSLSVGGR